MIKIYAEEDVVTVEVVLSVGWSVDFKIKRNSELDAILLSNQAKADLSDRIENIRRDAYTLGWKDAKAKKGAKRNWFNGNMNSDAV